MKSYEQLHIEINRVQDEISFLYKKHDALKKELQDVCPHENKLSVNSLDYSSVPQHVDYCMDCRKFYI